MIVSWIRLIKKTSIKIGIFLISVILVIICNQPIFAQNFNFGIYNSIPDTVENIASEVTVFLRDRSSDGSEFYDSGSGVIIARDIDKYYVLTVAHNLDSNKDNKVDYQDKIENDYQVKTNDGKYYYVTSSKVLRTEDLGELDLAIVTFQSSFNYQTAKFLDNFDKPFIDLIKADQQIIYVAGFPETKEEELSIDSAYFTVKQDRPDPQDGYIKNPDIFYTTEPTPFTGGYSLKYRPSDNNGILPGMSGGPIFTLQGNLIGIHGREDYDGNKRGIGIDVFWDAASFDLKKIIRETNNSEARSTIAPGENPTNNNINPLFFPHKILSKHSDKINSVAISPDHKKFISVSDDKTIKIWELETGALIHDLEDHESEISAVAINPSGQNFASGSINPENKIKLWNLDTGKLLETFDRYSHQCPCGANLLETGSGSYSGGGYSYSYSCSSVFFIKSCDVELTSISSDKQVLDISPDRATLVSNGIDLVRNDSDRLNLKYTIKIWNINSKKLLKTLEGHSDLVTAFAISPDSKTLASGSDDNNIKLWDLKTGELLRTLTGHSSQVTSLVISSDGEILASGSRDKTIKFWNLKTGQLIRSIEGDLSGINALAISHYKEFLVSGGDDNNIKLWNLENGQLIRTLEGHTSSVTALAISQDDQFIVSGSQDNTIRIWSQD